MITAPDGAKNPSELYLQVGDRFKETIEELLAEKSIMYKNGNPMGFSVLRNRDSVTDVSVHKHVKWLIKVCTGIVVDSQPSIPQKYSSDNYPGRQNSLFFLKCGRLPSYHP